jgi:hypothetical protein
MGKARFELIGGGHVVHRHVPACVADAEAHREDFHTRYRVYRDRPSGFEFEKGVLTGLLLGVRADASGHGCITKLLGRLGFLRHLEPNEAAAGTDEAERRESAASHHP